MLMAIARVAVKRPPFCSRRRFASASALFLAVGCTTVHSSAVRTATASPPTTSAVTLSATRDPPNAQQVGLVEAHGQPPLASLTAITGQFSAQVAKLGGDYGRIDSFGTRFEIVAQPYSYECGSNVITGASADGVPTTTYISQTCTGETDVEVGTLTLTGRAFRTQRATQ